MPFTADMRRKVDQIRDYLYGGGYPDPLTNAEQLSFLFFFYMIEGIDSARIFGKQEPPVAPIAACSLAIGPSAIR
jgi:hypothetical protein